MAVGSARLPEVKTRCKDTIIFPNHKKKNNQTSHFSPYPDARGDPMSVPLAEANCCRKARKPQGNTLPATPKRAGDPPEPCSPLFATLPLSGPKQVPSLIFFHYLFYIHTIYTLFYFLLSVQIESKWRCEIRQGAAPGRKEGAATNGAMRRLGLEAAVPRTEPTHLRDGECPRTECYGWWYWKVRISSRVGNEGPAVVRRIQLP